MINYIRNIKNPALKCFLQVLPFFILFFILKDFGDEIGSVISFSLEYSVKALSPLFRYAGEYIMGLITFIAVWSVYVYSCLIKTEKDLDMIKFWKTISHIVTVCLFIYGYLYITDTSIFMDELRKTYKPREALEYCLNLNIAIGLVCFLSVMANIYLIGTMKSLKKELETKKMYPFT